MPSARLKLLSMLAATAATAGVLAQGRTPGTTAAAATDAPAAETVDPGSPLEIGVWSLRAGGPDRPVLFTRCVRSGSDVVASGPGRTFALVPLSAYNTSMEMDSLIAPNWILHDGTGATHAPVALADLQFAEGAPVDLIHVPIGAERSGFLVFEVPEDVRELTLEFGGFRPGAHWRLDLSDERDATCRATTG